MILTDPMSDPAAVLVVEDDPVLAGHVARVLAGDGWTVDVCGSAGEGAAALAAGRYDLVVLDRMLPDGDGLDLVAQANALAARPAILVLSALGDTPARVGGLDAGADDYIAKPFDAGELRARARALKRRAVRAAPEDAVTAGELTLRLEGRQAWRAGTRIPLSEKEFDLLLAFARAPGETLTRQMLLKSVWGITRAVDTNVVDVTVARLRRKIDAGFEKAMLVSIHARERPGMVGGWTLQP
jgi:two-component system, OmpR family, response regulator